MPTGIYKHREKYNISKAFLIREYVKNKKTRKQIAKEVGCSKIPIRDKLIKYNIPIRPKNESLKIKYNFITKKLLLREYSRMKKSPRQIGRELGCSQRLIRDRLIEFDIPRRTVGEALRGKIRPDISKRMLLDNPTKSLATRRKLSLVAGGTGIPYENSEYGAEFDNALKEQIRFRDKYKCQLCGCSQLENGRQLDVHHIDYKKEKLNPDNLISLCRSCHMKTNWNRNYWQSYFKGIRSKKRWSHVKA